METTMKTEQKRKKKKGKPERTAVWAGVICLLGVLAMGCGFRGGTAGAVDETDGAGDAVQKTETLKDAAGLEIPEEEAGTGALTGTGEPEQDRDAGEMDRQEDGMFWSLGWRLPWMRIFAVWFADWMRILLPLRKK